MPACGLLFLRILASGRSNLDGPHSFAILFFPLLFDFVESLRLLVTPGVASTGIKLEQTEVGAIVIGVELDGSIKEFGGRRIPAWLPRSGPARPGLLVDRGATQETD